MKIVFFNDFLLPPKTSFSYWLGAAFVSAHFRFKWLSHWVMQNMSRVCNFLFNLCFN